MTNQCSGCGAELIEGSKFCCACGKNIEEPPVAPVQPQTQQPVEPKKKPKPLKTKKPRKKLVLGVSAIVIAVIIIVLIIQYLPGSTGPGRIADSRFVGEWEQNTLAGPFLWKFNSDSTLEKESSGNNTGTWVVNGTQLCLYNDTACYLFIFSNNGNMVTLTTSGQSDVLLTKKGQLETNQTPIIQCSADSTTNRITIDFININVKWSNIAISTTPTASWQVQDVNKNGLSRIGTTATIARYVFVGDTILLLDIAGNVEVKLTYLPTNAILGTWTVNV